jgi:hypothetical protein
MKLTVTQLSVHPDDDNPIFGERASHVSLSDEGAGSFITISQENGQVRLDFEEFEYILKAVEILKKGIPVDD